MFDVVLPCRNECELAEASAILIHSPHVESVRVIHNGCTGRSDALPFANKARAVNVTVPSLSAEYVCILDADIELSPTFFDALYAEINEMQYDAGSGLIMFMRDGDLVAAEREWFNNGGAMFIRREVLLENPLPENCVVEDTAYGLQLEKNKKLVTGIVYPAVAYSYGEFDDANVHKRIRQTVRYHVGALQLVAQHLQYSGLFNILIFIVRLMLTSIAGWLGFMWGTILLNTGYGFLLGSGLAITVWLLSSLNNPTHMNNLRSGNLMQLGFVLLEPLLIIPAIYIWFTKKQIW